MVWSTKHTENFAKSVLNALTIFAFLFLPPTWSFLSPKLNKCFGLVVYNMRCAGYLMVNPSSFSIFHCSKSMFSNINLLVQEQTFHLELIQQFNTDIEI